ncbi:MAG: hypothetical protein ACSLE5_00450 [Porticoccaceae bacterium]
MAAEISDIRIHKLVAKGGRGIAQTEEHIEAQTLLVIGSAKRQDDIWVGIGDRHRYADPMC